MSAVGLRRARPRSARSRRPRSRWPTSTATATRTRSWPRPTGCGGSSTRAGTATTRSRCAWPGASRTGAGWGRRSRSGPGACGRRSRRRPRCRCPLRPTWCSASARERPPDAVRIIWVSGIVQTETETGAAAEPGRRTALAVRRARPQALVVPVPLRLERRAVRVPHRLPRGGGDGLHRGPRRPERPRPGGVRADRARAARAPGRAVRAAGHERARGGAVPGPPPAPRDRPPGGRRSSSRTRA